MLDWKNFADREPELSGVTERLLADNEVAFLATTSKSGRPRLHPFVPKIVRGHLVAFIMDSSPKLRDLIDRGFYAIHLLPGDEDEQLMISGRAHYRDDETLLRQRAETAMGFATGVDEHHILFEFEIDRVLWTRWLDFGTPDHRPLHKRWVLSQGDQ